MVSWPTLAWRRATSSSRSSAGRLLIADVPPSGKASRQPERVEAVTPSSRERGSRSSPRSRRRTASVLRLAENRPRSGVSGLVLILVISGTPSRTIMVQGGVQRKPRAKDQEHVERHKNPIRQVREYLFGLMDELGR